MKSQDQLKTRDLLDGTGFPGMIPNLALFEIEFEFDLANQKILEQGKDFSCLLHQLCNIIGQNQINCFYGLDNVPGKLEQGYLFW